MDQDRADRFVMRPEDVTVRHPHTHVRIVTEFKTYRFRIFDRMGAGGIDTEPGPDGIGAICYPNGTAEVFRGEATIASGVWEEFTPIQ